MIRPRFGGEMGMASRYFTVPLLRLHAIKIFSKSYITFVDEFALGEKLCNIPHHTTIVKYSYREAWLGVEVWKVTYGSFSIFFSFQRNKKIYLTVIISINFKIP